MKIEANARKYGSALTDAGRKKKRKTDKGERKKKR